MAAPSDYRPPPPPPPPRPEQPGLTPTPAPPTGAASTLLVRHMPEGIPDEMLSRLFSYYGASSYRRCSGGRLRNCAFVDFRDENSASLAQSQLHRLRFHKKILSVERASNVSSENRILPGVERAFKDSTVPAAQVKDSSVAGKNTGTNAISISTGEPIAPRLGVDYPFPPHLEYDYPPPDGNILTNIVNALIAVPRFYTQVLHLMNKMNIPAPFRMALPTPPLPPSVPAPPPPPPPPVMEKPPQASSSSDESEMESSEEEDGGKAQRRKRLKREAIVGPASDKAVAHEDVGLKHAALVPKEVPLIKKKNPVLQIKIASKPSQNEAKDGESSFNAAMDPSNDNMETKPYATPQEIEKGKLPPEEILSLPMFKNYTAGNPATVLYIKNLAKDVVTDDFHFIFGSFFGGIEAAKSSLSIKLMQEGRMRGQAFVTFPSMDLAQHALNLANGYVFKGKPMIIQFGRNPAATKAN